MAESIESLAGDPKFAGLNIIQATYKHVGDHAIRADILLPRAPSTGKRPTIIRFHGGGLVLSPGSVKRKAV